MQSLTGAGISECTVQKASVDDTWVDTHRALGRVQSKTSGRALEIIMLEL